MKEKVTHFSEVEETPVKMDGAKNVYIRWLVSEKDGAPNFYLRMFRVEKGGHTPYHSHPYEHEVYVLSGSGIVKIDSKEYPLAPGVVAFVPPDVNHQFINKGEEELVFLCIIPKSD